MQTTQTVFIFRCIGDGNSSMSSKDSGVFKGGWRRVIRSKKMGGGSPLVKRLEKVVSIRDGQDFEIYLPYMSYMGKHRPWKNLKIRLDSYLSVLQRFYHGSTGHMGSRSRRVTTIECIDNM